MKTYLKLVALLSFIPAQGLAGDYAVQLEASKLPDVKRYEALRVHGNLYLTAGDNGYTRTRLGPYEHKDEALDVLQKVRAAGYADAFLAEQQPGDGSSSSTRIGANSQPDDIEHLDVSASKEWKMLTPDQQANLVYLDGVPHIKDGERFIPLDVVLAE